MKKYQLTYNLYEPEAKKSTTITVVTEEPKYYIERIKADLAMVYSGCQLGSYIIKPINHLRLVK